MDQRKIKMSVQVFTKVGVSMEKGSYCIFSEFICMDIDIILCIALVMSSL